MPVNGSVKIFESRFPKAGTVRDASIQIPDLPENIALRYEIRAGEEVLHDGQIEQLMSLDTPIAVDGDRVFSIHIFQENGEADVPITPNIAYMFQEHIGAEALADIR